MATWYYHTVPCLPACRISGIRFYDTILSRQMIHPHFVISIFFVVYRTFNKKGTADEKHWLYCLDSSVLFFQNWSLTISFISLKLNSQIFYWDVAKSCRMLHSCVTFTTWQTISILNRLGQCREQQALGIDISASWIFLYNNYFL